MGREYVVEKVFEHQGFVCVVAMMRLGHRCGYVGIPKEHKFYGKDYTKLDEYIVCHGGLTYSGDGKYPLDTRDDLWWFGWDYAHYMDGIDWESFEKNFDETTVEMTRRCTCLNGYPYPLYEVEEECKCVANQLKEEQENEWRFGRIFKEKNMTDFKVVLPTTTEEWQRDMNIAYNQALEDLQKMIDYEYYDGGYGTYHEVEMIIKMIEQLRK